MRLVLILWLASAARAEEPDRKLRSFLDRFCLDCHSGAGAEMGLQLDKLATRFDDSKVTAAWAKVYDRIAAGEMPPVEAGQPDTGERKAFADSLSQVLARADLQRQQKEGRTVLRRLNRVEFEHTVRDLLGVPHVDIREILPADPSAHGFDVVGEALPFSYVQQAAYLQAAEAALNDAFTLRLKPETKHFKSAFLDLARFQLARGTPRPEDNLALLSNQAINPPLYIGYYTATAPGLYRIRIRARAVTYDNGKLYDAEKSQMILLYAEVGASSRKIAAFEALKDRLRDMETTTWLNPGEKLRIICSTLLHSAAPYRANARDLQYKGPTVAFENFEAEGPLDIGWPPPNQLRVFGDLPVVAVPPTPKGPKTPVTLKVDSKDPDDDLARLLHEFARRAFRRPVVAEEVTPYLKIARDKLRASDSFPEALKSGYKAVLSAPDFLFLLEKPGCLDDFSLASRLSYFLWRSPPDEPLLAAAAAGKLHEPAELRAQVDRLLSDARSHRFIDDFTDQWFGLREINLTQPDEELYPEYQDLHLLDSLVREPRAYFAELVQNDLGVRHVVAGDFVCVNGALATLYGLEGVAGPEIRKVHLPPDSLRGGFLTQAAILKVTANGTTTSPVTRGAWVLDRILGRPAPLPPPNVPAIEPDIKGATTVREQLSRHRSVKECAACHAKIDPPGFALESFDVLGGLRDRYRSLGQGTAVDLKVRGFKVKYRFGQAVDASGETDRGEPFRDVREFKQLLLREETQVARNLVERLITFGTGAPVQFADRAEVAAMLERLRPKRYGVRSMIYEVVSSRMFQNK